MKKNNMSALAKNGYDVDFVNKQIKINMQEFYLLFGRKKLNSIPIPPPIPWR
jgi:hypothetical protein